MSVASAGGITTLIAAPPSSRSPITTSVPRRTRWPCSSTASAAATNGPAPPEAVTRAGGATRHANTRRSLEIAHHMHLAPLERLRVDEARRVAHGRREVQPPGRDGGAVYGREQRLARPRPCHAVRENQPHPVRRRGRRHGGSGRSPEPIEHGPPVHHHT